MSERTVIAVVTDLIKSGLTVEQQILVNELALLAADTQRSADEKRAWRDAKRVQRLSKDIPRQSNGAVPHTPLDINNNIKNISPRGVGTNPRSLGTNPRNQTPGVLGWMALFENFWTHFPKKVGKGSARKAYSNALKRASAEDILAGAKRYAASKPDPQFTKHPTTWLNADCWLDEGEKVVSFRPAPAAQRTWQEIKAEREGSHDAG
jgi:hypothetical protein